MFLPLLIKNNVNIIYIWYINYNYSQIETNDIYLFDVEFIPENVIECIKIPPPPTINFNFIINGLSLYFKDHLNIKKHGAAAEIMSFVANKK